MNGENNGKTKWYHKTDWPQFGIGVVGVLVVGLYTYYARQQYFETRKANEIAMNTYRESNKSFISFSGMSIFVEKDASGIHKHISFALTNGGNSAALQGKSYMCAFTVTSPGIDPVYNCALMMKPDQTQIVGPHQRIALIGPEITEEARNNLKQNNVAMYAYGYFSYTDTLSADTNGNPSVKITSFCQQLSTTTNEIELMVPNTVTNPQNGQTQIVPTVVQQETDGPIAGGGCKGFNYCLDDQCTLPSVK